MKFTCYFCLFIFSANICLAKLSASQEKQILAGEKIVIITDVKGKTWPKMDIYMHFPDVSPLYAFSFYVAYKHQKNYVTDVIKSEPVEQKSPTHVLVDYIRKMPWPISNAKYITGNIIEKLPADTYKISWYQVKSNSTKSADGFATFSRLGKGTLFSYHGQTEPKSVFASLLKNAAPKNLQKTLDDIKTQTLKTVKENPKLIYRFIRLVNDSFSGKWVYLKPKEKMK